MRELVRIVHGSHLYGTDTPESDRDFKAVHVGSGRDILMGRVLPVLGTHAPKSAPGEKNRPGDVDCDSYATTKFLALCREGQTVALELLFAPSRFWVSSVASEWITLLQNRERLVSRRSQAFIGYAQTQAAKYGIKGSRVAAARAVLAWLDDEDRSGGGALRLSDLWRETERLVAELDHVAVVVIEQPGGRLLRHLEVCNRKLPENSTVCNARAIMGRLVDEYGQRALAAERNEGVDWKATSHAVRVGRQAIELLKTGHVTFPRPEAAHLLAIKRGELPYQAVGEEIEAVLDEVRAAAESSQLPDSIDEDWAEDWACEVHYNQVRGALV